MTRSGWLCAVVGLAVGMLPHGLGPTRCLGQEASHHAPSTPQLIEKKQPVTKPQPTQPQAADAEPLWPRTWEPFPDITLRLRGRVDTDFIWSTQSPANQATYGHLGDVVGLRRARIGAEGNFFQQNQYIAEIDLASGSVVPRDVYLGFGGVQDAGEHRVGHFREPFSLEGGTSARFFAFLERSPANVFDPARNWGLGLYRANLAGNTALALGTFYVGNGNSDFEGGAGTAVDFTGRMTAAPVLADEGRRLIHLGLALTSRLPVDGSIVLNQQPRSPLLDLGDSSRTPFVPKIDIPASYQQLLNLQCAWAHGPLWSQAEWYGSWIDQTGGAGDVFFHGYHADCGWFLTGEHRAYEGEHGIFGPIRVERPVWGRRDGCRGYGAWELVARLGYVDLFSDNTPRGPSGQLVGVRQIETTVGVNWYLDDRIRLMFNYSYNAPDEPNTGTSFANIFSTRLGVFW